MEPWLVNRFLAFIAFVIGMDCVTEIVKAVARARVGPKRDANVPELAEIAERLSRLETTTEATAIEGR